MALVFLVLFSFVPCSSVLAVETIAVLLSERGGYYSGYLDALQRSLTELPGSAKRLRVVELPVAGGRPDDALLAGVELVVAVGVQATQTAAGWEGGPPVLSVLVPRASFDRLLVERTEGVRRGQFSAIYLDQPLARQINLLRSVLPEKKRVAAILGPDSSRLLPRLSSALSRAELRLVSEEVARESEVIPALSRLLGASDILLALPDSLVFTRETARSVLLITYRYQRPLIGFSQAYVDAGALAATFSTPAQIARQTAELVQALPSGAFLLPSPRYPAYFSVAVNRSVARALALDVPSDDALLARLLSMPESD